MSVLLGETRPVARRTHFCGCCEGTIGIGDTYVRQRIVGDDGPYVFKAHLLCDAIYWRIHRECRLWDDDGVDPSEVREDLRSVLGVLGGAA